MPYSADTDLLLSDIALPTYIDKAKFVQDAADEMDSQIGVRYNTPVELSKLKRPMSLLLKRINNFLATGRLILTIAASGEDDRLHAYGLSLVNEAKLVLASIADGTLPLDGADAAEDGEDSGAATAKILQYNKDPESNVEAFYDRVANPNYRPLGIPRGYTGDYRL